VMLLKKGSLHLWTCEMMTSLATACDGNHI
jgi:hypothetical protein